MPNTPINIYSESWGFLPHFVLVGVISVDYSCTSRKKVPVPGNNSNTAVDRHHTAVRRADSSSGIARCCASQRRLRLITTATPTQIMPLKYGLRHIPGLTTCSAPVSLLPMSTASSCRILYCTSKSSKDNAWWSRYRRCATDDASTADDAVSYSQ